MLIVKISFHLGWQGWLHLLILLISGWMTMFVFQKVWGLYILFLEQVSEGQRVCLVMCRPLQHIHEGGCF